MSVVAKLPKVGRVIPNAPWPMVPLGDVGRWFGGGTPSKANPKYWTGGTIPWVSPKDMKQPLIDDAQDHITEEAVGESSTNMVEIGSVLVVARSGILQHTLPVAITTRRVALNQDIKAVEPRAQKGSRLNS
jgi:type I restriction enzyme, S subunit